MAAVVELRKGLSYSWAKETDTKETYEFEFSSDNQWNCVRHGATGDRKFKVRCEAATNRLWWGESYFLDTEDFLKSPERCKWYKAFDTAKKRAAFVWLRRQQITCRWVPSSGSAPTVLARGSSAKVLPKAAAKSVSDPRSPAPTARVAPAGVSAGPRAGTDLQAIPRRRTARRSATAAAVQPESILEVDQIAVIFKPPYWKCELPAKGETAADEKNPKHSLVLLRWIQEHLTDIHERLFDEEFNPALSGTGFGPLAHRIDQETSGPLLVAKTATAQRHIKAQFHKTSVSKRYICLVHGRLAKTSGSITANIRTMRTGESTRSEVSTAGDWAQTDYQVVATYGAKSQQGALSAGGYSLVACDIKTGRTHQIRVHMLSLGHPLVADDKYLEEGFLQEDRTWCPRLFLHCYRLGFRDMEQNPQLVVCPLPDDLRTALVKLGAAVLDSNSSDVIFGETSWQRELFRPPVTAWRPGTRLLRRVATLIGDALEGEGVLVSQLNADAEIQQAAEREGLPNGVGRAWLSKHYDVFEVLPGSAGGEPSVRMRPAHAASDTSPEAVLERQIEAVRSELEELERQKQRAIAEEDYVQAGVIKRRVEAARAELTSLEHLWDEGDSDVDGDEEGLTYEEKREKAKLRKLAEKQQLPPPEPEGFTADVRDQSLFPSLVSKGGKKPLLRSASVPAASHKAAPAAAEGAGGSTEGRAAPGTVAEAPATVGRQETVLTLKDALVDFLSKKQGCVCHMNELNNDKFLRGVMAAQHVRVVNKVWLNKHEDTFVVLRASNNEVYVALRKAAQKAPKQGSKGADKVQAKSDQPKVPAYRRVVQRTSDGDPKPLVYQYGTAERQQQAEKEEPPKTGAAAWQDSFLKALRQLPNSTCTAEELLERVPLFANAMGAKKVREQRELLVLFLEGFPDVFRVDTQGSGVDKRVTVKAK